MDLTAKTCGPYEVWGPISEGGMSRVFLARHRELATPAIIKTLLDGGDAYARLRNEARLRARIPHPRAARRARPRAAAVVRVLGGRRHLRRAGERAPERRAAPGRQAVEHLRL